MTVLIISTTSYGPMPWYLEIEIGFDMIEWQSITNERKTDLPQSVINEQM